MLRNSYLGPTHGKIRPNYHTNIFACVVVMHTHYCFMQQCNEVVVEVHVGQRFAKGRSNATIGYIYRLYFTKIGYTLITRGCYRYTIFLIVGAYTKIMILLPLSSPWA